MSLSSVEHTMSRIAGSTAESPIAVFACNRSDMVNAMFADTVESRRKIRAETAGLIGVYDGTMNGKHVAMEITRGMRFFGVHGSHEDISTTPAPTK